MKNVPAFPQGFPEAAHDAVKGEHNAALGMTLRDYFAATALNGLLQNMHVQGTLNESVRRNVECAYQLADYMLVQRDEPSQVFEKLESTSGDNGSPK